MTVEDILRYCMAIKSEVEVKLRAKVWFSYIQETDEVDFKINFLINFKVFINIHDITDKMHTGVSAKEIAKTISDKALNLLMKSVTK